MATVLRWCSLGVDDLSVLISYKDLARLMDAARELDKLREDNKRIMDRLGALNNLYSELLHKVNELQRMI